MKEPGSVLKPNLPEEPNELQLEQILTMTNDVKHAAVAEAVWNSAARHIMVWLPIPVPHYWVALVRRAPPWPQYRAARVNEQRLKADTSPFFNLTEEWWSILYLFYGDSGIFLEDFHCERHFFIPCARWARRWAREWCLVTAVEGKTKKQKHKISEPTHKDLQ